MLGQEKRPGLTPQVAFAAVMALVLALFGGYHLILGTEAAAPIQDRIRERLVSVLPAPTSTPTGTAQTAEPVETPTPTPEPGSGGQAAAGQAPRPALRPLDTIRRDHYWLQRPIAPPGDDSVARFYPYGSRMDGSYPVHYGVEMVNAAGTPVLAPASGVVVVAGSDEQQAYGARAGFYGLVVIIQLDQRYQGAPVYVVFGHLSEVKVTVGQPVTAGQVVGLVGDSGYAESPHLHSEVRIGSNDYRATVNPELWYQPRPGYGTLAGALLDETGQLDDSESKLVLRSAGGAAEVFTYPLGNVNPDPEWTENFAIGDLAPGQWTAELFYKGVLITKEFSITPGETTWLVIPTR
ncbi:MAG: M23 family metallopeptidase [Anaerolineae bacterium]|jgi:murein DD-endopeptidase MepM/ murein hydrolase activator NlpD|nr:M23 family metallopeptidase [Chloroflexota bacterium]